MTLNPEGRFRVMRGKMFCIPPDDDPKWVDVNLIFDSGDDSVGIQLIGESAIKGYIFKVPRAAFRKCIETGTLAQEIQAV